MTYMSTMMMQPACAGAGIQGLTLSEVDLVAGGDVDWEKAARTAGKYAKIGSRLGMWGLAGAAVATAVYVGIDALD